MAHDNKHMLIYDTTQSCKWEKTIAGISVY